MASYQILYWQKVPTQIKAWDDFDEIKMELDPKFMVEVDKIAQRTGITDTDDYLAQWNWSEEMEKDGDADEVAEAVKREIESEYK